MKATTTDVEREQVRTALLAIADAHHGVLNPHAVLDHARDVASILHRYFEWDDSAAAEAYRLAQVGALVRHVRYSVVREHGDTREIQVTTTRAFQSRPSMRSRHRGYEAVEAILSSPTKRRELLDQVLAELSAYRKRYAELEELQSVWMAVDEARVDLVSDSSLSSAPSDSDSRPGATG